MSSRRKFLGLEGNPLPLIFALVICGFIMFDGVRVSSACDPDAGAPQDAINSANGIPITTKNGSCPDRCVPFAGGPRVVGVERDHDAGWFVAFVSDGDGEDCNVKRIRVDRFTRDERELTDGGCERKVP